MIGEVMIIGLQLAILCATARNKQATKSDEVKREPKVCKGTKVAERRQVLPNKDKERIVPVPLEGYQTLYRISDSGNVYHGDKLLKQSHKGRNKKPYVTLSNANHATTFTVERLVALAFLIRPAKGDEKHHRLLHKNGDVNDNRATNLMWK